MPDPVTARARKCVEAITLRSPDQWTFSWLEYHVAAACRKVLEPYEEIVRDLVELGDDWIDVSTAGYYAVLEKAQVIAAPKEERDEPRRTK